MLRYSFSVVLLLCLEAWGLIKGNLLSVTSFDTALECFPFCPISVLYSLGSGSEKPVSEHRLTATGPANRCPGARPDWLTECFGPSHPLGRCCYCYCRGFSSRCPSGAAVRQVATHRSRSCEGIEWCHQFLILGPCRFDDDPPLEHVGSPSATGSRLSQI